MHPQSTEIINKVMAASKRDSQHQMLLARCMELEPAYGRVMLELSPEEREVIDAYFLACTQMQLDLLRIAYACGRHSLHWQY